MWAPTFFMKVARCSSTRAMAVMDLPMLEMDWPALKIDVMVGQLGWTEAGDAGGARGEVEVTATARQQRGRGRSSSGCSS